MYVCTCMYVYMYVCVHVCIHVRVYIHMCTYVYVYMCMCAYVYVYMSVTSIETREGVEFPGAVVTGSFELFKVGA